MIRSTALRSIRSELRKLTSVRSTWVTLIFLLAFGIAFTIAYTSNDRSLNERGLLDVSYVTTIIQLTSLFAIIIGAMSVTSEYASNTMRTTTLARPKRWKAFAEKLIATTVFFTVAMIVIMAIQIVLGMVISGTRVDWSGTTIPALLTYLLALALTLLMTSGLGYILRSTAGTISTMSFVILLLSIATLLPYAFFRDTLPFYLPINLMDMMSTTSPAPNAFSRVHASLLYSLYTVIVVAFGYIRYSKSDI